MRKSLIACLLIALLLCGCGAAEEPVIVEEPVHVPLRNVSSTVTWDNISLNSFTPVTAFDCTESTLSIFPYNDNASYIKVEKFIFSSNNLFNILVSSCSVENVVNSDYYTLCTLPSGDTYALLKVTSDTGYLVSTKLPSSYCKKVVEMLCQQLDL